MSTSTKQFPPVQKDHFLIAGIIGLCAGLPGDALVTLCYFQCRFFNLFIGTHLCAKVGIAEPVVVLRGIHHIFLALQAPNRTQTKNYWIKAILQMVFGSYWVYVIFWLVIHSYVSAIVESIAWGLLWWTFIIPMFVTTVDVLLWMVTSVVWIAMIPIYIWVIFEMVQAEKILEVANEGATASQGNQGAPVVATTSVPPPQGAPVVATTSAPPPMAQNPGDNKMYAQSAQPTVAAPPTYNPSTQDQQSPAPQQDQPSNSDNFGGEGDYV